KSHSIGSIDEYLRQLGWREFAHYALFHFPYTVDKPFRSEFSTFPWAETSGGLLAWQNGQTGIPIIDAGMRELWTTGWMHNRVRMITASFLVKDILIPWQQGAQWFWETLVDADLANNTFGWQWTAGCGTDAAPFFRIFNPQLQGEKFDSQGNYVKKWIPELNHLSPDWIHKPWAAPSTLLKKAGIKMGKTYPAPLIDHNDARIRVLEILSRIKQTKRKNNF
ncbi:MAG: FAD-binding domain-containing protein, partial [Patescibacteria group bacterium]|nr:FAD-binding domain-containing protein [Patescibacteria group bacterium]